MYNRIPGHSYFLKVEGADGESYPDASLKFLQCEERTDIYSGLPKRGEFTVVSPGTTNEEVLRVLIDRLNFLNEKLPCDENIKARINLECALEQLESRTKDRIERGVESSDVA